MNREAVALGVPVYTTFGGRLGAVDETADPRRPATAAHARPPRSTSYALTAPATGATTAATRHVLLDAAVSARRARQ